MSEKDGREYMLEQPCCKDLKEKPKLCIGQRAKVTSKGQGLRIREAPSLGAKILVTMNIGTEVAIECGPVCANGIVWWGVKRGNQRGWSAEVQVLKDGEEHYYLEDSE
jgi:hypothetical protein